MAENKITPERIGELRDACKSGNFHVELLAEELCDLVELSGTDNEGFQKAAKSLKGHTLENPVVVQATQLAEMLERV